MTNPFAQPAAAPQQQAPAGNPFAQPVAPATPAPAQPNPFGAGVPTTPAPAGNPFGQPQQQAPAAPQAYAQPAQQQWAAPAQAAPVQQQYAAPAPLNASTLGLPPAPSAGGAKGPDLIAMYSRLVLVFPQTVEVVPRAEKYITPEQRAAGNTTQERMTATFVILDSGPGTPPGGTIAWGGNPHAIGGQPHTNNDPVPYVRKSMWLRQTQLIGQLRAFLPAAPGGQPGMLAGRVAKAGPDNNDPWYLISATEAELDLVRKYIELVGQGAYPHPLAP